MNDDMEPYIMANTAVDSAPLCPEIPLHLLRADAPMIGEAPTVRGEPRLFDHTGPRPYWAFAWASGQAMARFIMDNPGSIRGKKVVDFGSGSGICAIAAARAGAASVWATDIDPAAIAAIRMNATLNNVEVLTLQEDLKDHDKAWWDMLLASDAFYSNQECDWLLRHAAAGLAVLIADPTCRGFPKQCCDELARYRARTYPDLEDWTADVQIMRVVKDTR